MGQIVQWKVAHEVRKPLSFITGETLREVTSSCGVSVAPFIKLGAILIMSGNQIFNSKSFLAGSKACLGQ